MKPSQTHYSSLIAFLLFAIAAAVLLALGFMLGISALIVYLNEGGVELQSTIYSATMLFLGLLLGVVSVVSLLRFLNNPAAHATVSTSFQGWKIAAGLIGAGLTLGLGSLLQDNSSINWLALPLLTIPAVVLPLWTITGLGTRNLPLGSRWRMWGTLGISLTVTPFTLFMLEVIVVIVLFIFIAIYVALNPQVSAEFQNLSSQLAFIDVQSEEVLRLLVPYIMKPVIIIPVVVFIAVIIPLIEELLKPLAVWLLAGKLESDAQGFGLGALCGAGFALWETFNISGQMNEWGILLFTRVGTGLLHITTSALMGGAIYLAVRERRYMRLLGTYLLAALLHGLWNLAAITTSFSAVAITYTQLDGYEPIQWASGIGLIVLAIGLLILLVTSNHRLQKRMQVITPEEPSTL
jgi:hypothetical protein